MHGSPEGHPRLSERERLAANLEAFLKRYPVGARADWDEELAVEAEEALRAEERGKDARAVRSLLLERYVDAFYPSPEFPKSRYERDRAIDPVRVMSMERDLLWDETRLGRISELGAPKRASGFQRPEADSVSVRLYGTDAFVDLAVSGNWVRVSSADARVVGSPGFSCCQSLLGISREGDLCMAHIPGPGSWMADAYAEKILDRFGPGSYAFVSPERTYLEGARPESVESAERTNESFRALAKRLGLRYAPYPEIFLDDHSPNPDVREEFEILLASDGFQVRRAGRRPYRNAYATGLFSARPDVIYHRDLAAEPLHDVSF